MFLKVSWCRWRIRRSASGKFLRKPCRNARTSTTTPPSSLVCSLNSLSSASGRIRRCCQQLRQQTVRFFESFQVGFADAVSNFGRRCFFLSHFRSDSPMLSAASAADGVFFLQWYWCDPAKHFKYYVFDYRAKVLEIRHSICLGPSCSGPIAG